MAKATSATGASGMTVLTDMGAVRIAARMLASRDKQLSLTDPDARSMKNRDGGVVDYNVQSAVDAKHRLIVAHEVTNQGVDRDLLSTMAEQAREATGVEDLTVVADRGYYKSEEVLRCHEAGIRTVMPKTMTSNSLADGRYYKQDFIYIAGDNEYLCPAGELLIHRFTTVEVGQTMDRLLEFSVSAMPAQSTVHHGHQSTTPR